MVYGVPKRVDTEQEALLELRIGCPIGVIHVPIAPAAISPTSRNPTNFAFRDWDQCPTAV